MTVTVQSQEERTLHLPRILCLHGGGTNSRIFRAQCRVLEKALRPYFGLCYAQAPFLSKPGSDVVSVYANWGPFRAWLDPKESIEYIAEDVFAAIELAMEEDDRKGATGDFVGLLGFSQGAKLCGSLMAQRWRQRRLPLWQFAILLAGRGPLLDSTLPVDAFARDAAYGGQWSNMTPLRETPSPPSWETSDFPSLHVHGQKDPNLHLHRQFLYQNFDPLQTRLMEWDGEHRVPIKTKDVIFMVEEILSMVRSEGILE